MSLSHIALQCAQLLAGAQSGQSLDTVRRSAEDALVRFKIWAGNVGIFAPENASVDYRLRQDDEIVAVLSSILTSLKAHLEQAVSTTILEEPEDAEDAEDAPDAAPASPTFSESCSLSLDSDVSESALNVLPTGKALAPEDALAKANDEIDRLYRLASVLRKPISSTENARVRDFIAKQVAAGETEDMDDAEDHARSHLQARFPNAAPFLVDRLVAAVVLRRMQLRYRERHQGKLRQGVEESFAPEETGKAPETTPEYPRPLSSAPLVMASSRLKRPSGTPGGPSVVWSATNASSIDRGRYAEYAQSAALSRITHSAVARRLKLDVPAPPRDFDGRLRQVTCPYCMRLVSKEETEEPRWTRHILKDIKPYVCLFEQCSQGNVLFSSAEEWLGHLQWQHTIMWACQAAGHEDHVFGSPRELEHHIRERHPGSFTESQLPHIVSQGAKPAEDTFAMLAATLESGQSGDPLINPCPICRNFQPSSSEEPFRDDTGASDDIQAHIMGHLESVALLSLPVVDQGDEVGSNAKQSDRSSNRGQLTSLGSTSHNLEAIGAVLDPIIVQATEQDQVSSSNVPPTLDDDRYWRDICLVMRRVFPGPEDDRVLLSWYKVSGKTLASPQLESAFYHQVKSWLLPWLRPNEDDASVRGVQGSAAWFWAREDVQMWCTSAPEFRTLVLRGHHGCGKTVLSATVLEHLRSMGDRVTLYFSFDQRDPRKRTLDDMSRSLIVQLCRNNDNSAKYVVGLFLKTHGSGFQQPATEILLSLLHDMVKSDERVFVILDALNESTSSDDEMIRWLKRAFLATGLIQVRVLLTSNMSRRWYNILQSSGLGPANHIDFPLESVTAELSKFVDNRLENDISLSQYRLRGSVLKQTKRHVLEATMGNFWLAEDALDLLATGSTLAVEDMKTHLRLPTHVDLERKWRDSVQSMPDESRVDLKRLLKFVMYGKRPLSELEVQDILATKVERPPRSFSLARRLGNDVDIASHFMDQFEIFFSVPGRKQDIRMILLTKKAEDLLSRYPKFTGIQANKTITMACLTYVSSVASIIDDVMTVQELEQRYPLLPYIAQHMMEHAAVSEHDHEVFQALLDFFEDEKAYMTWARLTQDLWYPPGRLIPLGHSLYHASSAGLVAVASALIGRGADVNFSSAEQHGRPLTAACWSRHEPAVRVLLQNGADVNARGGWSNGSALQAACAAKHIPIMQLLLDWGADVNLEAGNFGNALQTSVMVAGEDEVRFLISKGADVNAIGGNNGTALCAATEYRVGLMKILLEAGADANLCGKFGSPIHVAVRRGNIEGVNLLLDYGAEIDRWDDSGNSALHQAASAGSAAAIEVLIRRGADVNAQNKTFETSLYIALSTGNDKIATMLRAAGAKE